MHTTARRTVSSVLSGIDGQRAPSHAAPARRRGSVRPWPRASAAPHARTSETRTCNTHACPRNCVAPAGTPGPRAPSRAAPARSRARAASQRDPLRRLRLPVPQRAARMQRARLRRRTVSLTVGTPGPRAPSRAAPAEQRARAARPSPASAARLARTSTRRAAATPTPARALHRQELRRLEHVHQVVRHRLAAPLAHQRAASLRRRGLPAHRRDAARATHGPCPIHCTVRAFSAWTTCTKSCGTGSQSRSRSIKTHARHGGYVCPYLAETRSCNSHHCPVDCVIRGFGQWNSCSKSCGNGFQRRSRPNVQPKFGGKACPHKVETRRCNAHSCAIPCVVGAWNAWTACTKSCGTGSQTRSRSLRQPENGGKKCPHRNEARSCNDHACAADCNIGTWGAWNSCSKSCGTGYQKRTRSNMQPVDGGKACPHSAETRQCNRHSCAVDCRVGNWRNWSTCTKSRALARISAGAVSCSHSSAARHARTPPRPRSATTARARSTVPSVPLAPGPRAPSLAVVDRSRARAR